MFAATKDTSTFSLQHDCIMNNKMTSYWLNKFSQGSIQAQSLFVTYLLQSIHQNKPFYQVGKESSLFV